jgi:hypothetical protein
MPKQHCWCADCGGAAIARSLVMPIWEKGPGSAVTPQQALVADCMADDDTRPPLWRFAFAVCLNWPINMPGVMELAKCDTALIKRKVWD